MLAAIVVISIFSGAAGVVAAQMLDLPIWASIVAYPLAGSVGMMVASLLALCSQSGARRALERVPAPALRPTQMP